MKVAVILPRIDVLGPVMAIRNLVNSLSKIEHIEIHVFYLDKKVNNIELAVPVVRLDKRNFSFSKYDIIHTNGIRPDLFAFLNRKKIRCHISTIHNLVFEDLHFTYNHIISLSFGHLWLRLWGKADKLICLSNSMKAYYQKWFAPSKLEVIYNGVNGEGSKFIPDHGVMDSIDDFRAKGLKVIGCAGVLNKRKGFDQILQLLAVEKKIALVVLGSGKELTALTRLSEKLKIQERCLFTGFKENAVSYFHAFDLFAVPSRSEGFGLSLIEAVEQKVPVICSDIEVFKELFNDNEVTFFHLDDLISLLSALKESIENGREKTIRAYARYNGNYTSGIMAESYYKIYKSAMV